MNKRKCRKNNTLTTKNYICKNWGSCGVDCNYWLSECNAMYFSIQGSVTDSEKYAGSSETSVRIYQNTACKWHNVVLVKINVRKERRILKKLKTGVFVSQCTGSHSAGIHVPFTNCFVCRWFCAVHDPKPPLHSRNWLSFGKFQDTERFLIHCERHFSSRLPPSGGTWKYAKSPTTKKNLERFSTYWYAPFCRVCLGCCAVEFGNPGRAYE